MKKKKELGTEMVQIAQRNHYEWKKRKNRRFNWKPAAIAVVAVASIAIGATTMALGSNEVATETRTEVVMEPVAHEIPDNFYPLTTVVVRLDHVEDLVVVRTSSGIEYSFHGIEDWWPGDICSCLMHNNGTDIVDDDIIIEKRYNGVPTSFVVG